MLLGFASSESTDDNDEYGEDGQNEASHMNADIMDADENDIRVAYSTSNWSKT